MNKLENFRKQGTSINIKIRDYLKQYSKTKAIIK